MNAQHPDNIITHALNAEARAYKMSGWAWLAFSLIAQGSMLALLRRAHPVETSQAVVFVIFSLLFAWWPLLRGIKHLWRARTMRSPQDLFRRALTTEPQLIAWVKLGTHTTIWTKLFNLVFTILFTVAHSLKNSWDEYGITGSGETADNRLPCIVIKLTNNQEQRLTTTSDGEGLKKLIAALLAHAPHAQPPPEPVSTQGDWLMETGGKGTMRLLMFLFGGPLMIICLLILFGQYMNGRERAEWQQQGVRTTATVSSLSDYGGEGSDYHVAVDFTDRDGEAVNAGTVSLVAKSDYENLRVGAPVEIFYKLRDSRDFRLVASLQRMDNDKSSRIVFMILSLVGFIMISIGMISIMRMKIRKKAAAGDITFAGGSYGINPPAVS